MDTSVRGLAVNVNWNADNGNWNVNAWQFGENDWNAENRVFSGNSQVVPALTVRGLSIPVDIDDTIGTFKTRRVSTLLSRRSSAEHFDNHDLL